VTPIQVVLVKWGTRYGAGYVNGMARAIASHTERQTRIYVITDQRAEEFDPGIIVRPFPEFGIHFDAMTPGCGAKMAMFARGITDDPSAPTVYFDLDSMVMGDIGRLVDACPEPDALYMMRSHYLPLWRISDITKTVAPEYYYRGNSSILVFRPERMHAALDEFCAGRRLPDPLRKPFGSDENFLSWWARGRTRVIPRHLAVRFAHEFMGRHLLLSEAKKRLPWINRRRNGLVAVSFSGRDMKPSRLVTFRKGEVVHDGHFVVVWDFPEFGDYFRDYPEASL
jgi:hypothetical protein